MPDELKRRDRSCGVIVGTATLAAVLAVPLPADIPLPAWRVAGVVLLMATWWITGALPIPATALTPLVLFPLLGVASMREVAAPTLILSFSCSWEALSSEWECSGRRCTSGSGCAPSC
ncbi:MAG: anion permease [Pseudolabrys sp.]|nr:anion permease [Pseudolabrys sp.]MDP2297951.1 anion permease [Pseudolabrys sp.]